MTSRAGTWLDDEIFARLNKACAGEPEPRSTVPTCRYCTSQSRVKGLCRLHYDRWMTHGDPLYTRGPRLKDQECSQPGCSITAHAFGLCQKHYRCVRKDLSKRTARLAEMAASAQLKDAQLQRREQYLSESGKYEQHRMEFKQEEHV